MTAAQKESFRKVIADCFGEKRLEFHHGDCVGADLEAANVVHESNRSLLGPAFWVVCHPPVDEKLRAFHPNYDEIREPKTHFARNRDIVNETDALIVCPIDMCWQPSGGTWYTHDYAVKRNKKVIIVWPNGLIQAHPEEERI